LSVGNVARNGLWSALLAQKGFDGPPEPLAGVQGLVGCLLFFALNYDQLQERQPQFTQRMKYI
jgi:2-methylcitrate dehydratase PrpD